MAIGNLHYVIVRERSDGNVDLIDTLSRAKIGQYRLVTPFSWGLFVSILLTVWLVIGLAGYTVWQFGRSYGQAENRP